MLRQGQRVVFDVDDQRAGHPGPPRLRGRHGHARASRRSTRATSSTPRAAPRADPALSPVGPARTGRAAARIGDHRLASRVDRPRRMGAFTRRSPASPVGGWIPPTFKRSSANSTTMSEVPWPVRPATRSSSTGSSEWRQILQPDDVVLVRRLGRGVRAPLPGARRRRHVHAR